MADPAGLAGVEMGELARMTLPPHDLSVEAGVLGCAMLAPAEVMPACMAEGVSPESFYDLRHQEVWKGLSGLADAGLPIDTISLQLALKTRGTLDAVNQGYLSSLPDQVPSAANLGYYLAKLLDLSYARAVVSCSHRLLKAATDRDSTGLDDLVAQVETEIYSLRQSKGSAGDRKASYQRIITSLEDAIANKGKLLGLSTGFGRVDRLIGGLQPKRMIVLAARPSMGKSSLALNIAEAVAGAGHAVGFFTLEMSEDELNLRTLGSQSRVDISAALRGELTEREIHRITSCIGRASKLPIHIRDRSDLSIAGLRSECRRMIREHQCKLFIVDYLGLLTASHASRTRQESMGEVSRGIKAMAKELDVPVIALAQLNRKIEERTSGRPMLSDLRETGDIEQDADTVGFLWEPSPDQSMLSFSKNRCGPTEEVPLDFDRPTTRFSERSPITRDLPPMPAQPIQQELPA